MSDSLGDAPKSPIGKRARLMGLNNQRGPGFQGETERRNCVVYRRRICCQICIQFKISAVAEQRAKEKSSGVASYKEKIEDRQRQVRQKA